MKLYRMPEVGVVGWKAPAVSANAQKWEFGASPDATIRRGCAAGRNR
jgi:hypothetical protein